MLLEARAELHQFGAEAVDVDGGLANAVVLVVLFVLVAIALRLKFIEGDFGEAAHETRVLVLWGILGTELSGRRHFIDRRH
jgi:hypothetical protein